jgi:hypothetical protein
MGKCGLCLPDRLTRFSIRDQNSETIVGEQANRSSTAAAKNENTSAKRIFRQLLLAELRQGIDPFSAIDRLDRYQHPHLRCNLDHRSALRQASSNAAQSGGVAAFQWMRILGPCPDSNSITYSSTLAPAAPINSTKDGWLPFRREAEDAEDPFTRFFSLV